MKKTKRRVILFKRKRKGLTNYKKRLKLLLAGKPRLVIRKSLKNISAQVIEYKQIGDTVLVSAHSSSLDKLGWKMNKGNLPSAYLVGLLLGKKVKEKGIKDLILDIGLQKSVKGSRIYALLKGVIDAGVNIPHSEGILPGENIIKGEHIAKYASQLKSNEEAYKKRFSSYLKNNVDPMSIGKYFEEIKNKILGAK